MLFGDFLSNFPVTDNFALHLMCSQSNCFHCPVFFFPVPYGHVYICRPCFSFFSFQFVLMSEYQRHVTFQGKVLHFSVSFLFWDFLLPWMIFPWKRNSLFLGWDFFWVSILVRRLLPCNSGFVLSLLGMSLGFKSNNIFLRLQCCTISHIEFKNPWSYFWCENLWFTFELDVAPKLQHILQQPSNRSIHLMSTKLFLGSHDHMVL